MSKCEKQSSYYQGSDESLYIYAIYHMAEIKMKFYEH